MELLTINGETIVIITLYGENRSLEVTQWHAKVMREHFQLPVNYLKCPFPGMSHGWCMNEVLRQSMDSPSAPDYYWFVDNDALILQRQVVDIMYSAVRNKVTVWGQAWNSSHKTGPNGTAQHPYVSQACVCFAREMYNALGRPDMDHNLSRSDTAEEMTYAAEEKGYCVSLQYPSYSASKTTALSQSCWYGHGNIYGPNLTYHESRADLDGHVDRFIEMCKLVLADAFEGPTPARPYAYAS